MLENFNCDQPDSMLGLYYQMELSLLKLKMLFIVGKYEQVIEDAYFNISYIVNMSV